MNKDWRKGFEAGRKEVVREMKKEIRKINLEDAMTEKFSEFKHFLLVLVDIAGGSKPSALTGAKK